MWERAKTIATEMLDGKLWLPEVGKATHYHATYVRPGWVRDMNKMHKLGVHIFYRPRAWGDGAKAPEWGDAEATSHTAKKLVEAAKQAVTGCRISDICHPSSDLNVERDVEAGRRMGDPARRNVIDAGRRHRGDRFERDAARSLEREFAAHHVHRLAHGGGVHVVEQHRVREPDSEHFAELIEGVDLDLDL